MKILYFSRDYTPHDHRILSSLAKTDHRVYYLRLEKRGHTLENRSLPPEIELLPWSGGSQPATLADGPRLLIELKAIVRKLKPDLVQAGPLQRCALLAALAGIRPLVSMSWGYDLLLDAPRNVLWRQATRFVLSRSDLMIGDCNTIRKLASSYGMPEERIVTFPWGIDLKHFSPQIQPEEHSQAGQPTSTRPFTLLSTRSWEPIYGVDTIAQAFILAAKHQPNLRLVMLGNGSQASSLKKAFLHAGLFESQSGNGTENLTPVIFPGQISYAHLPRYYHTSDLYISASHSDGTSISLLEAMACGRPALVSDIPGNREWVVPEENGWLFRDGDPAALAMAIRNAAERHERLPEMGRNARKTVEERANWEKNFQKMLDAYELVVSRDQRG